MPVYEYQCRKCGKVFDSIQKFSDEPLKLHADCGGDLDRLISAPALHFKGSGWYVTDYAKGGSAASATPGGKGDAKSESKSSESKSDAPAATPPAAPATPTKTD